MFTFLKTHREGKQNTNQDIHKLLRSSLIFSPRSSPITNTSLSHHSLIAVMTSLLGQGFPSFHLILPYISPLFTLISPLPYFTQFPLLSSYLTYIPLFFPSFYLILPYFSPLPLSTFYSSLFPSFLLYLSFFSPYFPFFSLIYLLFPFILPSIPIFLLFSF